MNSSDPRARADRGNRTSASSVAVAFHSLLYRPEHRNGCLLAILLPDPPDLKNLPAAHSVNAPVIGPASTRRSYLEPRVRAALSRSRRSISGLHLMNDALEGRERRVFQIPGFRLRRLTQLQSGEAGLAR